MRGSEFKGIVSKLPIRLSAYFDFGLSDILVPHTSDWYLLRNFTLYMSHEIYMQQALKEASKAFELGEVPVGAIIMVNEKIIARAYNQVEQLTDSTAHAEIMALTTAFNYLGSKYLPTASIYITVEPCLMCAGALYWSKIGTIVYGASDEKNGYLKTAKNNWPFHPKTTLVPGILKEECALLMQQFFRARR